MGAINVNGGTLTAVRVAFLKNKSPHGLAGAIFLNGGSATLDTCSFTGNSNTGGGAGAIQLDCVTAKGCVDRGGTISLVRCRFVGNTNAGHGAGAGAIQVDAGTMGLDGCSFEGNTEDDLDQGAGAIQVRGNASVLNGARSCSFFGGNSVPVCSGVVCPAPVPPPPTPPPTPPPGPGAGISVSMILTVCATLALGGALLFFNSRKAPQSKQSSLESPLLNGGAPVRGSVVNGSFLVSDEVKCNCCFCAKRRKERQQGALQSETPSVAGADEPPDAEKFTARTMRIGNADAGARGIWKAIGITENGPEHMRIVQNGMHEIEREFTTICGHCDAKDEERYRYIAEQKASHLAQKNGVQRDIGNEGKTLDDFLKHPNATKAELEKAHVLALRLYTSNSYTRLNTPFRWPAADGSPHPYAATVFWIWDAIRKLRAVLDPTHFPMTFYRGMKDMEVAKQFVERGGTEMACMSTSADKGEALKFAESRVPLLLQFEIENHMQCGADISWLSMYPEEKEWLFPPLTYLKVLKTSKAKSGEGKKRIPVYHIRAAIA
jgi:hypothetical protein